MKNDDKLCITMSNLILSENDLTLTEFY